MSRNSDDGLSGRGATDGFDQTNDLSGDQLGESDGSVAGETANASDRTEGDTLGESDPEGPGILPRLLGDDNEV